MTVYLAKITNEANIARIFRKEKFVHDQIYNFEKDIKIGDYIFLYLGGDKKKINWQQGLIGCGRIVRAPYDKGYDKKIINILKLKSNQSIY